MNPDLVDGFNFMRDFDLIWVDATLVTPTKEQQRKSDAQDATSNLVTAAIQINVQIRRNDPHQREFNTSYATLKLAAPNNEQKYQASNTIMPWTTNNRSLSKLDIASITTTANKCNIPSNYRGSFNGCNNVRYRGLGIRNSSWLLNKPIWDKKIENAYVLYVARFFLGVANGAVCVLSPMYISEISDSKFRGTLGSFFEFLIYVAVVFVAICGAYFSYITLTITIGVICCALSITFIFLPESPCHLLKMNKPDEAKEAIRFYRSKNSNVEDALKEIYDTIETQRHQKSLKEALRSRCVVRGLIASVGLTLFQKFSGIDSIIYYTVNIFQETEAGLNAYTSSIIVTSVQLITAAVNVFVAESANRRTYLFMSTIGMGLSLAGLATFFLLKDNDIQFTGFGYMPLVSLVIYAFSFSMGLGPILWMLYGELFAPDVKGLANGITMSTNWGFSTVVTKCFPIMVVNIGPHYTFYLFSLCMFACSVFIKFCVPETRGKTLDQIQSELSS
ncbi:hypothetical protein FQA39_LY02965 [Lamprigera yunnana]|nr:hypothetical protein FQA39_LY02965 [Lamprigera yunnana]